MGDSFLENPILKIVTPLFEDINGKFQGGRVKVVGIPGGTPKSEKKNHGFSGGGPMQKNGNFRGNLTGNLTRNPGGSTTKKNRYPQPGGEVTIFFLENPNDWLGFEITTSLLRMSLCVDLHYKFYNIFFSILL